MCNGNGIMSNAGSFLCGTVVALRPTAKAMQRAVMTFDESRHDSCFDSEQYKRLFVAAV